MLKANYTNNKVDISCCSILMLLLIKSEDVKRVLDLFYTVS